MAVKCRFCGEYLAPKLRTRLSNSDPVERILMPVDRSSWAIAAGYLGLFSLLPFFGIFAIIVAIIALRDLKRHPDLHGKGRAYFGLVMGVLFTLLYAVPITLALVEVITKKPLM